MANEDSENKDDIAGYLLEMAKTQGGVACATVEDGHVLLFTEAAIEHVLKMCKEGGKGQIAVFVKRPVQPS
jgi:hypothetical protein